MASKNIKGIAERFLIAMREIIASHKLKGGKVIDAKTFSKSIGQNPQNLNAITQGRRNVSLAIVEAICRKHLINPTWLIMGSGEMKLREDNRLQLDDHENRIRKLEKIAGIKS